MINFLNNGFEVKTNFFNGKDCLSLLNKVIKNPLNNGISTINIAISDDLWDYFSRFSVNN